MACKFCEEVRRRMEEDLTPDEIQGATIGLVVFGVGFALGVIVTSLIAWVW